MAQPEHALQIQVKRFVAYCVAADHEFWACDRSKKQSPMQHVREKARGIRAGVADCTLAVAEMPEIYIELKWPPNKPTDQQKAFGDAMCRIGRRWCWADSLKGFRQCMVDFGVPLRPNAEIVAAHLDALLASAAIRKSGKAPRSYRAPRAKASPRQIAAAVRGALFTGRGQ